MFESDANIRNNSFFLKTFYLSILFIFEYMCYLTITALFIKFFIYFFDKKKKLIKTNENQLNLNIQDSFTFERLEQTATPTSGIQTVL